jgi:hypothetical protein
MMGLTLNDNSTFAAIDLERADVLGPWTDETREDWFKKAGFILYGMIAGIEDISEDHVDEFYPGHDCDNRDRRLFVLDDGAEHSVVFWCPDIVSAFETRRQLTIMIEARVVAYVAAKRLEITERSFRHRWRHHPSRPCGVCESRSEELDRKHPRTGTRKP